MPFMFENLDVYKKAIEFVVGIYSVCKRIKERDIKYQLKRAVLSIPLNIAEGNGRNTTKEKVQFYKMARGSLFECIPLLEVSSKINEISEGSFNNLYGNAEQIGKMLNGLIRSLEKIKVRN